MLIINEPYLTKRTKMKTKSIYPIFLVGEKLCRIDSYEELEEVIRLRIEEDGDKLISFMIVDSHIRIKALYIETNHEYVKEIEFLKIK